MQAGTRFKTVDEYISAFPASTKKLLQQLRRTIKAAAPEAEELISYNMPAYKLDGMLVFFAGYKNHIGLYPTPSGITGFQKELAKYQVAKATVRFPIDQPLPLQLITRIVQFRARENRERQRTRRINLKNN